MSVPVFTMMVGLPGSGKSTLAEKIAKKDNNTIVLSSDALREELCGNIDDQTKNRDVFEVMNERTIDNLKAGKSVVYDATNVHSKGRVSLLKKIKDSGAECTKVCRIVPEKYGICIKRNAERERHVPNEIINRMRCSFETPYYFEGWDRIEGTTEWDHVHNICISTWMVIADEFEQDNPHHDKTLGGHSFEVVKILKNRGIEDEDLLNAALLHDIGKLFTRKHLNRKGEGTKEAHYYGHENVGAYEILFTNVDNPLYVSLLVNLHMRPMNFKNEETINKYKSYWGEKIFSDVMTLYEADREAHAYDKSRRGL